MLKFKYILWNKRHIIFIYNSTEIYLDGRGVSGANACPQWREITKIIGLKVFDSNLTFEYHMYDFKIKIITIKDYNFVSLFFLYRIFYFLLFVNSLSTKAHSHK